MDVPRELAPSLIGEGTVSSIRDMVRALETLEGLRYSYTVDGVTISEGSAALVKLMADDSSTMLVNGCLFLNVTSFRYLHFRNDEHEDDWVFELHGDGTMLRLVAEDSVEGRNDERSNAARVIEGGGFGPGSYVRFDDDEDDLPF